MVCRDFVTLKAMFGFRPPVKNEAVRDEYRPVIVAGKIVGVLLTVRVPQDQGGTSNVASAPFGMPARAKIGSGCPRKNATTVRGCYRSILIVATIAADGPW